MALSANDITRLAQLARLDIDDGEATEVRGKLDAIFALIDALQAIDTSGVEPMSHAQDLRLPLRDDRVTEVDRHVEFQRAAPSVAEGLYLVPRVLD